MTEGPYVDGASFHLDVTGTIPATMKPEAYLSASDVPSFDVEVLGKKLHKTEGDSSDDKSLQLLAQSENIISLSTWTVNKLDCRFKSQDCVDDAGVEAFSAVGASLNTLYVVGTYPSGLTGSEADNKSNLKDDFPTHVVNPGKFSSRRPSSLASTVTIVCFFLE
ncbi:hypothetical protein CHS0354_031509 [Potamilus streckersoni]|uniref:Uncharacterized protein n=1 Tax=Potamilus streckersoni TaxID=2493646 RepID=A0AAE0SHD8_9BIVA|nr:hypothetical protein CHS0354_031509 [Potamilus streckersoni]